MSRVCSVWPALLALLVASTATVKILSHWVPWRMLLCLSALSKSPGSCSLQPLQGLGFGIQVTSLVGDLPAKWMICQRTTQTTKGRGVLVCCRDYWRSLWCHTLCQWMSCKCLKLGEVDPNLFLYSFRVRSFAWTLNLWKDTGTQV